MPFALAVTISVLPTLLAAQVPPLTQPPTGRTATMHRGSNLADPAGLSVGLTGGLVAASGEAFLVTGAGYGVATFFGVGMEPFNEIRFGISFADVPESRRDDRTRATAIYVEPYLGTTVFSTAFRFAPRVARMWEWRPIFTNSPLNGWGFGGAAGVLRPISSRVAIDVSAAFTGYTFGPANIEGLPDGDGRSYASVWEIRIGTVFRLKEKRARIPENELEEYAHQ